MVIDLDTWCRGNSTTLFNCCIGLYIPSFCQVFPHLAPFTVAIHMPSCNSWYLLHPPSPKGSSDSQHIDWLEWTLPRAVWCYFQSWNTGLAPRRAALGLVSPNLTVAAVLSDRFYSLLWSNTGWLVHWESCSVAVCGIPGRCYWPHELAMSYKWHPQFVNLYRWKLLSGFLVASLNGFLYSRPLEPHYPPDGRRGYWVERPTRGVETLG